MITKSEVIVAVPPHGILRVEELEKGCCFLSEHRLWIKKEHGYCLALDNFVRYQIPPLRVVERAYQRVHITVE